MASSNIPLLDALLEGEAEPLGPGSEVEAVGAVQDLLFGHGQPGMPGLESDARGLFGPRTRKAVDAFRRKNGLSPGTLVDRQTLSKLVEAVPSRPLASQAYLSLALDEALTANLRVVSLVSRLQGGGLFAQTLRNPDHGGLSVGLMPWSQRGGRLNDLLVAYKTADPTATGVALGTDQVDPLITLTAGPSFGLNPDGTTNDPTGQIDLLQPKWSTQFGRMGLARAFQSVQVAAAKAAFAHALATTIAPSMAKLTSERGVAFAFDLILQFGDDDAVALYDDAETGVTDPLILMRRLRDAADEQIRADLPNFPQAADRSRQRRDFLILTGRFSDELFVADDEPGPADPLPSPFEASRAASYFLVPRPSQGLLAHVAETRAFPFINGVDGFLAMSDLIRTANAPGDFIYMLNWHFEHDLQLIPGQADSTLESILTAAAANGAEIRSMIWMGPTLLPTGTQVFLLIVDIVLGNPLLFLGVEILERVLFYAINLEARVNAATAGFLNDLAAASASGLVKVRLDGERGVFGSHHQKLLVVGSGGTLTAFVGGIEYNKDRLLADENHESGAPLFDTTVRLEDRGAWLALQTFVDRWKSHPLNPSDAGDLSARDLPMPASTGGRLMVQLTHTYGRGYSPRPGAAPVWTASDAISNGILNARTYFYIEDQYFVGSRKLNTVIRQAMGRNPNLIGVVVMASEPCVSDLDRNPITNSIDPSPDNVIGSRRRAFLRPLIEAFPGRLLVFNRLGTVTGSVDPLRGDSAYVHSKLVFVDDEAAFIGSVNSNQRSWYHDTEVDATIVDADGPGTPTTARGWVRDFRCMVWEQHLGSPCNGDPKTDLEIWKAAYFPHTGHPELMVRAYDLEAGDSVMRPSEFQWIEMYDPL